MSTEAIISITVLSTAIQGERNSKLWGQEGGLRVFAKLGIAVGGVATAADPDSEGTLQTTWLSLATLLIWKVKALQARDPVRTGCLQLYLGHQRKEHAAMTQGCKPHCSAKHRDVVRTKQGREVKKALKTTQCYAQQDGGGSNDADGEEEEDEKFKQKAQRGRNDEEMAENGISEVGLGLSAEGLPYSHPQRKLCETPTAGQEVGKVVSYLLESFNVVKPMKGHAETSLPLEAGGKTERQLGPYGKSSEHLENSDLSSKETCTKKLSGPSKAKKGGSAAMATCCRQESMEPSHLRLFLLIGKASCSPLIPVSITVSGTLRELDLFMRDSFLDSSHVLRGNIRRTSCTRVDATLCLASPWWEKGGRRHLVWSRRRATGLHVHEASKYGSRGAG
ncbi:hypothetical protein PANDA_000335 [Ailuropoda melanoleuca]|uniref:Uncharacterized protein n=1 Tax=Ailuropoda melanoleuca TaxID=9646 RepID=D2GUK7_AILME|nr:hypothetical protein PANDA_000335 [Ailuropoda melanoleuca]